MKCNSILDAVGRTPLIRLNRIVEGVAPQIYVKADYLNPGGSVKDRIGITMIDEAERKGLLKPGGTIIEATSGNTGMGLALVAAVRGYKVVFTINDKQSKEKIDLLKALGAEVIVCPTAVEPDDPRHYHQVAHKLAKEIPNSYYPDQYSNPDNPRAHYLTTAPEIWDDTEGKITHFVCGLGTGGTVTGAAQFFKEKNPAIQIIGVDPVGSIYYDWFKNKKKIKGSTYVVQGIGGDCLHETLDFSLLDEVVQCRDEECFVWTRRLARLEGIFTGGSTGGAVAAAVRLGQKLPASALIVVFVPDTGMRYLSNVYNDEWMRDHGYVDAAVPLRAEDILRVKRQSGRHRELIAAEPYQTVFHALRVMQSSDISQLPVFEDKKLIGAVYEDKILNLALQGKDLRKLVIREVMGKPLPLVPRDAPIERVTHLLSHEGPAVFVEMGNGHYEILTKYDLMGTIASLVEQRR
ncbi:MAG: pyridoxal-phosphate dependent enzyme [Candidatus Acidiferrales bacterium]